MRFTMYAAVILFSSFLGAQGDNGKVFYIDPFDISVSAKTGNKQVISFGHYDKIKGAMNCYKKIFADSDTSFKIFDIVEKAKKDRKKIQFNTYALKTDEKSQFWTPPDNVGHVWSVSTENLSPSYSELRQKDFMKKYSRGGIKWLCCTLDPLQWWFGRRMYTPDYLPEGWDHMLESIRALDPGTKIKVANYLSWSADYTLPKIPVDLIFIIESKEGGEASNLTLDVERKLLD